MRIAGCRQIAPVTRCATDHHLGRSLIVCSMVRHRMFSGVSLTPGLSGLMREIT